MVKVSTRYGDAFGATTEFNTPGSLSGHTGESSGFRLSGGRGWRKDMIEQALQRLLGGK